MSLDAADAITWMELSINQIWSLLKKDILLEVRQQYSFYGILLYIGATIFVLFLSLNQPEAHTWNGLFWVIQLFVCMNAVAKSFLQESRGRMLYYQSVTSPVNFIAAKLIFNTLLMLVMSALSLLLFSLFLRNPAVKMSSFLLLVLFGGWSISLVFSFLAAIAAKASGNAAIMAILGFPIIIPQLIMLIKASAATLSEKATMPWNIVLMLLIMDILVILLSIILFPFLWKD